MKDWLELIWLVFLSILVTVFVAGCVVFLFLLLIAGLKAALYLAFGVVL